MKALDKVRVRTSAAAGTRDRHAMWALRKNPADLAGEQRTSLATIQTTNKTLYRAYQLKEQLRELLRVKGDDGRKLLAGWLSWAMHSPSSSRQRPPSADTASWFSTPLTMAFRMPGPRPRTPTRAH